MSQLTVFSWGFSTGLIIGLFAMLAMLYWALKKQEKELETQNKGKAGEAKVYRAIREVKGNKHQIKNLYVHKAGGETTEVDCVVICPKGIIAIEVKNFGGTIYGGEQYDYWKQRINPLKTFMFYNPVKQNRGHIKAIKAAVGEDTPCYSVILFGDKCALTINNQDPNVYIGHIKDTKQIIGEIMQSDRPDCLSEERMKEIAVRLEMDVTEPDKEKHAPQVKEQLSKCPKCGKTLITRTNRKTGEQFWGCPDFPKCMYRGRPKTE